MQFTRVSRVTPTWPPSRSTIFRFWIVAFFGAVVAVGLTQYLLTVYPSYTEGNPVMAAIIKQHGFPVAVFAKCAGLTTFALTTEAVTNSRFYYQLFLTSNSPQRADHPQNWWAKTTEASCALSMAALMTVDALWNTYTLVVTKGLPAGLF